MESLRAVEKIPVTLKMFIMVAKWGGVTVVSHVLLLLLIFLIVRIRVCQSIGSGLNGLVGSVSAVGL